MARYWSAHLAILRAMADRDRAGLDRLLGDRFAGVEHSGTTVARTYVLTAGEWRLLSNVQFRDPRYKA